MTIKIALIPAYEPDVELLAILAGLKKAGLRCVTVDDGSGPAFEQLFAKAEKYSTVLHHRNNWGKGAALKTGLKYISQQYGTSCTVVTLDADGQHAIEDALKVTAAAVNNTKAIVLGCRDFTGDVPLRSKFGNSITKWIYRFSSGLTVRDTQTGLRAFSGELINYLASVPGERYEYEMNVLMHCAKDCVPLVEIPINTIYLDSNSSSHFSTIKDSYRIYKEIIKFSLSSLTGFLTDYCMYSLLLMLTSGLGTSAGVVLSNITARIVSASVNYTVNRKIVFKEEGSAARSAAQYFILAGLILIGNTWLLNFLVVNLAMNQYIAKLFTEFIFFIMSYLTQKYIIFRRYAND